MDFKNMDANFKQLTLKSLQDLEFYCIQEHFAGYDPYDGLNSRIFKKSFINKSQVARLLWIQTFKRNPLNLRSLFKIDKQQNSKALGLFLSGYAGLLSELPRDSEEFREKSLILIDLSEALLKLSLSGYSGTCWGYNFDWQARGGLYFPVGTPNIVATAYAAYGLYDAYEIILDKRYLNAALGTAEFIMNDLSRDYRADGSFLFSYSPIFGNNCVYNASLMSSKLLARAYSCTGESTYLEAAKQSVRSVLSKQRKDGSWFYGELPKQNWIDSFHTGFNIESLYDYMIYSGDISVKNSIDKAFAYYIENFFTHEGKSKYYNDELYPIDIHSPAQLICTLHKLNKIEQYGDLVNKVLSWTISNMQSRTGFFYYQRRKYYSVKISYMRWSNAWMFNALSKLHS